MVFADGRLSCLLPISPRLAYDSWHGSTAFPMPKEKKVWVYVSWANGSGSATLYVSCFFFFPDGHQLADNGAQYVSKPSQQGYLVTPEGKRVGEHEGLWYYTIGQRARVGGMVEPHFVAKKGVGETGQDILIVPGR